MIFFTSLKRIWVESGKNKHYKIRRIMSVPWSPLFGVMVSIYDRYERWKHYGQLCVVIISIQALQWVEKTAMIVLNKEFLLFNRCNQSSISTPEPFSTDPRVHIGQFDLTWVGAPSNALGLFWRSYFKLFLLAVTKFHGKLGLNSSLQTVP